MDSFDDDEIAEMFANMLEEGGIASIVVDDGVIVGFTSEKLRELLKLSEESKGRVVIHVVSASDDDDDDDDDDDKKLLN